jgi:hypothetical protein
MVIVDIDINTNLVEPMKNRKDTKMIQAYNTLLLQLMSPRNMSLTTRYLKTSIITFATHANLIWNWCHQVATDTMQPR